MSVSHGARGGVPVRSFRGPHRSVAGGRFLPTAVVGVLLLTRGPVASVDALEEHYADLPVSVEVASVFKLSLDNSQLVFQRMSPGKTEILGEGQFFNALTCRANTGRPWYLKAQLVSLKHVGMDYTLPASLLRWKAVEVQGVADPFVGRRDFQAFADQPVVIYASQGSDRVGQTVVIRLQYSLSCPLDAPAGDYVGQLIFTMAESP